MCCDVGPPTLRGQRFSSRRNPDAGGDLCAEVLTVTYPWRPLSLSSSNPSLATCTLQRAAVAVHLAARRAAVADNGRFSDAGEVVVSSDAKSTEFWRRKTTASLDLHLHGTLKA